MDIITVQKIIAMIDTRLDHYEQLGCLNDNQYEAQTELINLSSHLQSFIEAELNAAENQTAE